MKLSYRGAQYEMQLPQVQSDSVETVGTYRGAPATWRHLNRHRSHHHEVEMTYRGVKYSQSV
ncbi:DUF4278 domain-containing protein [Leptolyngbya sp. KIOST-1]|uniref:DUF4278 domain-containing protein n=1 Tax=Leptolyngbya sp. KIOST-1 TaxID=1229172 RepID=UPI00055ABA3B|nr:DUF4278 domain-containing protein [Leptolyngbya sp. KIOST-1]